MWSLAVAEKLEGVSILESKQSLSRNMKSLLGLIIPKISVFQFKPSQDDSYMHIISKQLQLGKYVFFYLFLLHKDLF